MTLRIHLGFEVGTGEPVDLPLHHTMITGQTRISGKTTTIEALLSRLPEDYQALVFRTKRGEIAFEGANRSIPYYRPEVDWEYVQELLEAAMRQRLRFERSWIIRASEGASTLRQVYDNIKTALDSQRIRGIDESVYTNLRAYFEKILPQLEEHPFASELELEEGINVIELGHLSEEVQALVISSCLEEIYKFHDHTVVVIPEAWLFLPQSRGNPVKWSTQHVIRQGGASDNYLWLDSQDVTTVTKDVLKSMGVWLLGRQQEINEVKRVIDQLPVADKPRPNEVMTLPLGHFYVATEDWCRKVYVQPAWASESDARAVATGNIPLEEIQPELPVSSVVDSDQEKLKTALARSEANRDELEAKNFALQQRVLDLERSLVNSEEQMAPLIKLSEALQEFISVRGNWPDQEPLTAEIDMDVLAEKVASRLGNESPVWIVNPLEALKHRYQQETVDRLAKQIEDLDVTQRRSLEWLLAVGKSSTYREVCNGLGIATSGNSYVKFSQGMKTLVAADWVHQDSHGLKAKVREKVEKELASYNPGPEEVEKTFQHLVNWLELV